VHLEELDLAIPPGLIAQEPVEPRDACRLLVTERGSGRLDHRVFRDLPELLAPGDVLVLNSSKVLPARVRALKATGGHVELLFLRPAENGASAGDGASAWEALARPSRRLREGMSLALPEGDRLRLQRRLGEGVWAVSGGARTIPELLDRHGELPLPPYITAPPADLSLYQTVYADQPGSAAAPTAGLHFTPELLRRLEGGGIETVEVTLHVGLDTFRPIAEAEVEHHPMHAEAYTMSAESVARLDRARAEGRRLVAVGTTAVRVLETVYADSASGEPHHGALSGVTQIFITPGYRFRAVDALVTNFHLPRTSLLALVMAFAGVEPIRRAYAEAVARQYRFFSFGDAMLLLDTLPAGPSGGDGGAAR
jgi:S-adenosylmethionine:tRNA ribosyltransferase-isomerase